MTIEEISVELVQYGTLGLWTIFNMYLIFYYLKRIERHEEKHEKKEEEKIQLLKTTVENNTKALTIFNEKNKNL